MSRMTQPPLSLWMQAEREVLLWYIPPSPANRYRPPLCEPSTPLLLPPVSDLPLGEDGSEGIWGNLSDSPAVEVEYPVESFVGFVHLVYPSGDSQFRYVRFVLIASEFFGEFVHQLGLVAVVLFVESFVCTQ